MATFPCCTILFTTHTILPSGSALAASRENCSCLQGTACLSSEFPMRLSLEKKKLRKTSCYHNFPNKRGLKFVIKWNFVEFIFTGTLIYKDTYDHRFFILSSHMMGYKISPFNSLHYILWRFKWDFRNMWQ